MLLCEYPRRLHHTKLSQIAVCRRSLPSVCLSQTMKLPLHFCYLFEADSSAGPIRGLSRLLGGYHIGQREQWGKPAEAPGSCGQSHHAQASQRAESHPLLGADPQRCNTLLHCAIPLIDKHLLLVSDYCSHWQSFQSRCRHVCYTKLWPCR